jgi:hypothetical protein
MNPRDRQIDQNRSQENKWRKGDAFDEQRKSQTVVRAPQRDPKPIEFMPACQEVKCEVDPNERGAGPPKLGIGRSQGAARPD